MDQTLFIGAPFSGGQPHPGVSMAPDEFRKHHPEIFSKDGWRDIGNITGPGQSFECAMEHARLLAEKVAELPLKRNFFAAMGGDHGLALGTIHGLLHHHPDLIVVWIDAHADANVPSSSPTGNMHGMPLAWLLGAKEGAPEWLKHHLHPRRLIYVGVRDVDPYERMLLQEWDIAWIRPEDFSREDGHALIKRELRRIDPTLTAKVHISLDVDALDANSIHATGTRVHDGLTFQQIEDVVSAICESHPVVAMEAVEVNPKLGTPAEVDHLFNWVKRMFLEAAPARRQDNVDVTQGKSSLAV